MFKIIATLAILSLFVSLASAAAGPTSQSSIFSSSLETKEVIVYGANASVTGSPDITWQTIPYDQIAFGPASKNNETLYVYGVGPFTLGATDVYVRALNATIVAEGSDQTETSYIPTDNKASVTIGDSIPTTLAYAVGPGYFAILAVGTDSTPHSQVYLVLADSSGSATPYTLTDNSAGTYSYSISTTGSIFYDPESKAFFYTFLGTAGTNSPYFTINVGGYFASGSTYFADAYYTVTPSPAFTSSTTGVSTPIIGPNNFTNASEIYVVYKDETTGVATTYYSKIPKETSTTDTTFGTGTSLVADDTASTTTTAYVPIGVWASDLTYGISLALTSTTSSVPTYTIANYYNLTSSTSSATPVDSGLGTGTAAATQVIGWRYYTGYTLIGVFGTATADAYNLKYGVFDEDGSINTTANSAAATLASGFSGPFNVFEDVNGSEWIGWTDFTESTSGTPSDGTLTLDGYLAKLQKQIFSTFANALKGIMAVVAFCLAALFTF